MYYFKKNCECDFIVADGKELLPVQEAFELTDGKTKQRGVEGLLEACQHLNVRKGMIITSDEEEDLAIKGVRIEVRPFYQYFLR